MGHASTRPTRRHGAAPARLAALAVLCTAALAFSHAASAQTPRPGDEIWRISTRHLGFPSDAAPHLETHRYEEGWQASSAERFLEESPPQAVTCIYVNAARVQPGKSVARGFQLYRRIAGEAAAGRPLRFVIWLWPTPITRRPLQDFRVTAVQTDCYAYYLAWFLSRMDRDADVGLLGYSYGATLIAGASQGLASGRLAGRELPAGAGPDKVRAVLWSAAMPNDWLLPGRRYGEAMSRIDRSYIVYNSCDPVLQRFRLVMPCERPAALGYTGLPCPQLLGEASQRITQENGAGRLGRSHEFDSHFCSSHILGRTITFLLGEGEAAAAEREPVELSSSTLLPETAAAAGPLLIDP